MMKISETGKALIRKFEGLRLEAYQDGGGVWTVGYGHTGPTVVQGLVIDEVVANALLDGDIRDAEDCINRWVKQPLTQNEFDALCSFVFNLGCLAFQKSTLLRLINIGDFDGAAMQFKRWIYDNGKVVNGLVARRQAEADLFEV